jgi:hypothetical protein
VGIHQPVDVTITGQATSRSLFSYSNPYVDASSALINGLGLPASSVRVLTTLGGDVLSFTGGNFGSDVANVTVKYGPPGALWTDSTNYPCAPIDTASFSPSTIKCTMSPGVGADLHVMVRVRLTLAVGIQQEVTLFEQYSAQASDAVAYPTPVIINGTLASPGKTEGTSLRGSITAGEDVEFSVDNIGTDASLLKVYYGEPGGPYDQVCSAPSIITPNARLSCRTAARIGVEGPYVFVVWANGAVSDPGTDEYSYPADPMVTAVQGCTDVGVATGECPTAGGNNLLIIGDKVRIKRRKGRRERK